MGFGTHICLGQYVAYEMIPETVRQILLAPGSPARQDGSTVDNPGGPFAESFASALRHA